MLVLSFLVLHLHSFCLGDFGNLKNLRKADLVVVFIDFTLSFTLSVGLSCFLAGDGNLLVGRVLLVVHATYN